MGWGKHHENGFREVGDPSQATPWEGEPRVAEWTQGNESTLCLGDTSLTGEHKHITNNGHPWEEILGGRKIERECEQVKKERGMRGGRWAQMTWKKERSDQQNNSRDER